MDFFERAHVPKETSSKSDEAVKRQLKQMMYAYKKGNNKGILTSSEMKPKYDFDEIISVSDYSEISGVKGNDTMETVTSNATSEFLSSIDKSSKSNTDDLTQDSLDDVSDYDESKSSSALPSENPSTSSTISSATDWSDSNDSDLSIPSSLQISAESGSDVSDDEDFDADGALASKILQKLGKKDKGDKKRKLSKGIDSEIIREVLITDENTIKHKKKSKKSKKTDTSSSSFYVTEHSFSDNESELHKDRVTLKEEKKKKQQSHENIEVSNDSFDNDMNELNDSSENSISSAPFISISAEDMLSQSLSELLGEYVHPTIKNLPTETLNIPMNDISSMFPSETMIVNDMMEEEISSLVPEVDEDLAIEDLNLDTDVQELTESVAFNDTIVTEDSDEIRMDDSTIIDEIELEQIQNSGSIMTAYTGDDCFIILMKNRSELHIHGKVRVTAICGTVDVFGYLLQDSSLEVYAPYSYHAQCIKPVDFSNQDCPGLENKLASAGISASDINEILSYTGEFSTIIQLSKLNSRKIDFVDNNYSIDLFSRRGDYTPRFLKKASESLGCSFYVSPPTKYFEQKPIWDNVLSCGMSNQSRGIVCGGKGTGKSTFLRHYINRSLPNGPVLVLDLDPGQSEFTVPGSVSATIVDKPLIGPNFTHLKTPERMLNIGMVNTMENTRRYLSAVTELIAYCRNNDEFKTMPWVVNTMGMSNHMGLKFMTYIILQLRPTFLFQIDAKVPKRRFDVELDSQSVLQLYHEEYCRGSLFRDIQHPYSLDYSFLIARPDENGPKNSNYGAPLPPRDERYLNVLAYFGQLLNEHNPEGILDIVPYKVKMRDLNIGLNVKIPEGTVTKVINGKIIALCQRAPGDKGGVFTLGDKPLLCHGHGLIRGISEEGILYILTPVEFDKLRLVNTLVYGDWMPELRGQERDLPEGTAVPYRTAYTVMQHRKLMYPPRRRFNPLQLLRVSRNS